MVACFSKSLSQLDKHSGSVVVVVVAVDVVVGVVGVIAVAVVVVIVVVINVVMVVDAATIELVEGHRRRRCAFGSNVPVFNSPLHCEGSPPAGHRPMGL